ncbi:MAG: hypothetical protein IPN00_12805 [Hydrogenophilales bacterium]|nr:hypothetical protein [Hydrogenophilales bacterium]
MQTIRYADEKEVTLPFLLDLFQHAQYEASINDDGVFMVLAETALVSIDILTAENVRLIRLTSNVQMKDAAPSNKKLLSLIN